MYGLQGEEEEPTTAALEFSLRWAGEVEGKPVFLAALGLYTVPEPGRIKMVEVRVSQVQGLGEGAALAKLSVRLCGAAEQAQAVQEVPLRTPLALQPGQR